MAIQTTHLPPAAQQRSARPHSTPPNGFHSDQLRHGGRAATGRRHPWGGGGSGLGLGIAPGASAPASAAPGWSPAWPAPPSSGPSPPGPRRGLGAVGRGVGTTPLLTHPGGVWGQKPDTPKKMTASPGGKVLQSYFQVISWSSANATWAEMTCLLVHCIFFSSFLFMFFHHFLFLGGM